MFSGLNNIYNNNLNYYYIYYCLITHNIFSENDNDNKMTMTTKRICKSLNINILHIVCKADVVISLAKRHLFWVQTVIILSVFVRLQNAFIRQTVSL